MARPSKYKKEMCDVVLDRMAKGWSVAEVCAEIGISKETFYQWAKDERRTGFPDAVKKGRFLSQAWWEKQARINLNEKSFNHVLWFMNMKNRFSEDWSDKKQVEVSGDSPIKVINDLKKKNKK